MSNNHKISAVIIACNEEQYIQQCIESILPITTDIIVIDSGSTDKTVSLAKSVGAQVYHMPWKGYGANKNFGISKAKHDWILSIDADEILNQDLINDLKKLDKDKNIIYKIKSLVNFNGKWIYHSGWYPAWKLRFFHKDTAYWNLAPVHEELIYPAGTILNELKGQLLHYSFKDIEDHRAKADKYAKLKAETWIQNGKSVSLFKKISGPSFKFLRTYLLKFGFLDGKEGFIISKVDAMMIRAAITHYHHLKKND